MKVSVIIPVYNVYNWLDECLDSVVNQTFQDFEVILINDGSTDGSDIKCAEWAERDNRIRFFSKENEGLSPTRNLGVEKALGDYFLFVDSDDWLDARCLELLYQKVKETNADIVECDVYKFNDVSQKKTSKICYGGIGIEYTKKERMMYGYTAVWKCLIRREFYLEHNMKFPDCHSPARGIYAALIALSNRVACVKEPLYYYRTFRKGSLTDKPQKKNEVADVVGVAAFEYLINEFHRLGIVEEFADELERTVKYKLSDLLAAFFHRKSLDEYQQMSQTYYAFIDKYFPTGRNFKYITIGGYNLNQIVWYLNLLHDPYCRFNFSSIISIMHPTKKEIDCLHPNHYREIMVKRELENEFWKVLKEVKPEYLFLDFIEERHDVIRIDNSYLTQSDAFLGSINDLKEYEIINRQSVMCEELWKKSAVDFILRMEKEFPRTKIVVVKNYLSEKAGDICHQIEYDNVKEIRETNAILKKYYEYFEASCDNAVCVDVVENKYYYTDKQYEYGTIPSHLNCIVNMEIARELEKRLWKNQ